MGLGIAGRLVAPTHNTRRSAALGFKPSRTKIGAEWLPFLCGEGGIFAASPPPPSSAANLPLSVGLQDDVAKTASLFLPQAALRRFCPPPVPGARVQTLPHKNRSRMAPFLCGEGGI